MTEDHTCLNFVAHQIKYWRKKKGITQSQLSEKAGIKYRHFQDIEAGKVDVKFQTLGCISRALHISPSDLLQPLPELAALSCEKCEKYRKQLTGTTSKILI